jgi:hypothetical protein
METETTELIREELIANAAGEAMRIRIPRTWLNKWKLADGDAVFLLWHSSGKIVCFPQTEWSALTSVERGYCEAYVIGSRTLYIRVPARWFTSHKIGAGAILIFAESNISHYLILSPPEQEDGNE